MFRAPPPVVRPKVTPDPQRAAALERRRAELEYRPQVGFLVEQRQERKCRGAW
jgi:hypothetical protein